jgi:nucleoside 2-deoxyribosyltransferase
MKIYVAASSRELPRVRRVMSELRAAGYVITHDWVPGVEAAMERGITEAKADDTHAFAAAHADLQGVADANCLVFLAPTESSKMAWSELGYALALNIPVVVAHDDRDKRNQSIVTRLAHRHCTDEDIVHAVSGWAA